MVNILFKLPQLPFHGEESHKNLMFGIVMATKNRSLTTKVLRREGSVLQSGEGWSQAKGLSTMHYCLLFIDLFLLREMGQYYCDISINF